MAEPAHDDVMAYGSTSFRDNAIPLLLICQNCGNVQEFRFDLAPEAIKNWKP